MLSVQPGVMIGTDAAAVHGLRQESEAAEADETKEANGWAGFAARLRAEVRARLPDPQSLVAAHSALVGRSTAKPPAGNAEDEEMPEVPDEGDAAASQQEVSACDLSPYAERSYVVSCTVLASVRLET